MKRFLALVMVGVMTLGMSVFAASSPSASAVKATVESTPAVAAPATVEYFQEVNNVITKTPGIENPAVVGVPTGVIVDGVKMNYTIKLGAVTKSEAQSALGLGGKVLNVFKIRNNIFKKAQIALWCESIKAGQNVAVYQVVNGQWKQLTSSVREGHVDVVLEGNGLVAVIAK